ncbi:unnamed protein product [Aureobasidium uvarum]|uniref:BTB domain-containing protein n=1 Tax=Aureobasidium uvarum TaxID=2773716 RepID=A0A9N8KJT3_9PEZI|nr:unnamed protein product [Aureobasidium uvarum]
MAARAANAVSIHRKLLCLFSSYYAAALNGNFLEANKDRFEVDLSGEHLRAFAVWIYTGSLGRMSDDYDGMCCLTSLYLFADQVNILALRRRTISLFAKSFPTYDLVKIILMNVTPGSPLHRHVLDRYILHWTPSEDEDDPFLLDSKRDPDHILANFMYQVMKGLAVRQPKARSCGQRKGLKPPAWLD